MDISKNFRNFHKLFPYLEIKEEIEYFSVFGGFEKIDSLNFTQSIFEDIKTYILKDYESLSKTFNLSTNEKEQEEIERLLKKIAIGERKIFSLLKDGKISQIKGREIYRKLFKKNMIEREISREKPILKNSKQPLKKHLRQYKIEDKIKFSKPFYRFWFTFIAPNKPLIKNQEFNKVLNIIERDFDKYVSFFFEELSNELIKRVYKNSAVETGSYWERNKEIDMLAKIPSEGFIAGECKWKNQKICKNTLNKLKKKCEGIDFKIEKYALFSKSGFSKELLSKKYDKILLFDLKSFERLREDG